MASKKSVSAPKGALLIIGGREEKIINGHEEPEAYDNKDYEKLEIIKRFLLNLEKTSPIEIITTASKDPKTLGKYYLESFGKQGFKKLNILDIKDRNEANSEKFVERIEKCSAIFFTGGDQFRITTILGSTKVLTAITKKYQREKKFIIGGTSAGAMAAPKISIYRAEQGDALLKGQIKMTSGLGFIDNCIIDTHFVRRPRFGRLVHATIINQNCSGIGLGENTALIVEKGNEMECLGSGMVTIIDGSKVTYTNVAEIDDSEPINLENLIVHILKKGDRYLLNERKFIPSEKLKK